ncbi:MAG: DUF169 domain-containing protein [Archaeoglobales archaeon]|nr:DUF169 domain-containing protein [Archaeoglobales archaeon]
MEIENVRRKARELREVLSLKTFPVGVKLLKEPSKLDAKRLKGYRYCQALMRARHGEHVLIGREDLSCAAASAVFGFKPMPESFKTGEQSVNIGIAKDKEVGAKIYEEVLSFAPGEISEIYLFPLETAILEPDVVIVEDKVERLMWIVLAYINAIGGERVQPNTAVMRATCLDCTAIPFKTQKINISLGCYGCRSATDIEDDEALVGFPFKYFESVVDYVKLFSEKAIPNARSKKVFKALQEKGV